MVISFWLSVGFRLLVGFRVFGSMCVGPCKGEGKSLFMGYIFCQVLQFILPCVSMM